MSNKKLKPRRRKITAKFEESANTVPCCRHVQRRIIRNLHRTPAWDINTRRKRRSQELHAEAKAESERAAPAQTTKPAIVTVQANAVEQTNKVARAPARQVLQSAVAGFKNGIKAVRSFAKRKAPFWPGSQWPAVQKQA